MFDAELLGEVKVMRDLFEHSDEQSADFRELDRTVLKRSGKTYREMSPYDLPWSETWGGRGDDRFVLGSLLDLTRLREALQQFIAASD